MTNIELIEILKKSVSKFGELPVNMNIVNCVDSNNVKDALYDDESVTLYNY